MIERVARAVLKRMGPFSAAMGSVIGVRTGQRHIVLTFDDGPDPATTPQVLETLAAHGASATFFVLMGRARRHPDLISRIVAEGHELALHGLDHVALPTLSRTEVSRRTAEGRAELEELSGTSIRWMRPPYGRQRVGDWLAVRRSGVEPVLWGTTLWDAKHTDDDDRIARALRMTSPGTIVLAHDAIAGPEEGAFDGEPPVVDRGALIDRLLSLYEARGLSGVSLEHALRSGKPLRRAWFSS
jgi:peptidoglycan/xylan/chitin deacetylase (PgdA/CDA1 family)